MIFWMAALAMTLSMVGMTMIFITPLLEMMSLKKLAGLM